MKFLNKNNWFIGLILNIITLGLFSCFLGKILDCYDKDEWYYKWQYWVFGTICLVFPVFIMLIIFIIEMNCKVACKLKVIGNEIYNVPYYWIICFIIPIVGWTLFIIMYIYVITWPFIKIAHKKGEEYLKKDN